MGNLAKIIKAVENLSAEDKLALFQRLNQELKGEREKKLSQYQGLGQGVWQQDAQEYITSLRTHDR